MFGSYDSDRQMALYQAGDKLRTLRLADPVRAASQFFIKALIDDIDNFDPDRVRKPMREFKIPDYLNRPEQHPPKKTHPGACPGQTPAGVFPFVDGGVRRRRLHLSAHAPPQRTCVLLAAKLRRQAGEVRIMEKIML